MLIKDSNTELMYMKTMRKIENKQEQETKERALDMIIRDWMLDKQIQDSRVKRFVRDNTTNNNNNNNNTGGNKSAGIEDELEKRETTPAITALENLLNLCE
ncbi:hypothetical protein RFI_36292 [Reticulomyxa filosa]|uniref:Uncharacterized protein n=1 Tax=Reticulomyxa filosa TaxID=46433 RepID=X6LGN0_RETFI|nr:hypothetical protein RFI_36292 [Reticulomyxa filosa]|eukprot:ETO01148.1 hypothetical protein RFI_36292 [Reticulomyxa filosa]